MDASARGLSDDADRPAASVRLPCPTPNTDPHSRFGSHWASAAADLDSAGRWLTSPAQDGSFHQSRTVHKGDTGPCPAPNG
ncbi:hypothetical protein ACFPM0_20445 [Pseudonocardia sulfidoxydans]|uniref:hypothetical protein n=1 Tax=Pseudonocardia sulfidoxydans TaxID=54011 RepID=UPI00361D9655